MQTTILFGNGYHKLHPFILNVINYHFCRLICSDAMARGMDIDNVRFVISYGLPPYLKTYIHRVGRTARAGKPGIAFSLLQKSEVRIMNILGFTSQFIPEEHIFSIRVVRDGQSGIAFSMLQVYLNLLS